MAGELGSARSATLSCLLPSEATVTSVFQRRLFRCAKGYRDNAGQE